MASYWRGPRYEPRWFERDDSIKTEIDPEAARVEHERRERERLSLHESAHAVLAHAAGLVVTRVWLEDKTGVGWCTWRTRGGQVVGNWPALVVGLAGEAFDYVFLDRPFDNHSYDRQEARKVAARIGDDPDAAIGTAWEVACNLVREHSDAIRRIGSWLDRTGELSEVEVAVALANYVPEAAMRRPESILLRGAERTPEQVFVRSDGFVPRVAGRSRARAERRAYRDAGGENLFHRAVQFWRSAPPAA